MKRFFGCLYHASMIIVSIAAGALLVGAILGLFFYLLLHSVVTFGILLALLAVLPVMSSTWDDIDDDGSWNP